MSYPASDQAKRPLLAAWLSVGRSGAPSGDASETPAELWSARLWPSGAQASHVAVTRGAITFAPPAASREIGALTTPSSDCHTSASPSGDHATRLCAINPRATVTSL